MKKLRFIIPVFVMAFISVHCSNDDLEVPRDTLNEGGFETLYSFGFNEESGLSTSEGETGTEFTISATGNEVNRMQGVDGNALFFDGLSTTVSGELPTMELPQGLLTISLWTAVKSYPIGTAGMVTLMSQGGNTGAVVGLNKFGRVVVQLYVNGALQTTVASTKSIPRHQWSHITVSIDTKRGVVTTYLNKERIAENNTATGLITWPEGNTQVFIGKNAFGEKMGQFDIDYFSGALDEIRIIKGRPGVADVSTLFSAVNPPATVDFNTEFEFLAEDTNRPIYHPIPDYGWTNEPNGLMYYKGEYHMFYQKNDVFLGIAQQNWGHMKSQDLVTWEDLNNVLWPTSNPYDNFGAWAGDATVDDDGNPVIVYTGVNGVKASIALAVSFDDMQTFEKFEQNPVIAGRPSDVNLDFRDPFIWKEGNTWYMIVGAGIGGVGGNTVLYASNDLYNWDDSYQGVFFQGQMAEGEGEFWEVPIVHKFPNGKYLFLVQKTPDHTSPARTFYWIGDFNGQEFIPDHQEAKDFEVVNGFLSPTVTVDAQGRTTAIGIIPDEVSPGFQQQAGWAHLFSIPQVWELDSNNELKITPHPNVSEYRGEMSEYSSISLTPEEGNYLNESGRHYELNATLNTGSAEKVGFVLGRSDDGAEQLKVYYDVAAQEWVIDASQSSLAEGARKDIRRGSYPVAAGENVDVRIFVDGSVLEVFINGEDHFTGRFFPTLPSADGIELFVEGGNATAENVKIWEMQSSTN